MEVQVLFFGILKEVFGGESEKLAVPANATVAEVLQHYKNANPRMAEILTSLAVCVNQEYASIKTALGEGDEVGLLPPVSGGSPKAEIMRERIDASGIVNRIKCSSDGAVVVFEGVGRNQTRGRRTLYLDYEAYEEMARKQMESLASQAIVDFKIRDVNIVHRVGRVEIGETSVVIVVASEHRAAAFEACRWLIDTLKRTVPVWKKEHFEDGSVWADGEPFPDEIRLPQGTI